MEPGFADALDDFTRLFESIPQPQNPQPLNPMPGSGVFPKHEPTEL